MVRLTLICFEEALCIRAKVKKKTQSALWKQLRKMCENVLCEIMVSLYWRLLLLFVSVKSCWLSLTDHGFLFEGPFHS